jgi:hypothetical protein
MSKWNAQTAMSEIPLGNGGGGGAQDFAGGCQTSEAILFSTTAAN